MYPGKVLEDVGSILISIGGIALIGSLFGLLEIAAFTIVVVVFISASITLCAIGCILLSVGYKKHIKWCKEKGYING